MASRSSRPVWPSRTFSIVTIAARRPWTARIPFGAEHAQLDDLDDAVGAKPASFEELYERHRLDVYRYLRAWGSSEDQAADLTSATFERAYRALAAPRPPQGSRAWLVRIARNLAIDAARRRDAARLSAREIGQVLGRSEAAAHKLMNRALTALREAYRDDD